MSVLPIPISRKKKLPFGVKYQTGLATVGSIMLSQKTIPGNFAAKYLKPDGQSKKTKQKLEESCSQVVFAIFIPAKLTQI